MLIVAGQGTAIRVLTNPLGRYDPLTVEGIVMLATVELFPNTATEPTWQPVSHLFLQAANKHEESLELFVVGVLLPEIHEPADHLQIAPLVVAVAVDPVERWQQIGVVVRPPELEGQTGQCAAILLPRQQLQDQRFEFALAHMQFLELHPALFVSL